MSTNTLTKNKNKPDPNSVYLEFEKGNKFNSSIKLTETVKVNEDFFIGKQWENVKSNGLPTPVFNFLKRATLFQVASITTDNIKMQCSPLAAAGFERELDALTGIVNREFESIFEANKVALLLREFMRNAAVDGDGCLYTYWDSTANTGQVAKGRIVTEIVENTRVFFGNPNDRRVQTQPYIIISRRSMVDEVRERAKENGESGWALIEPDGDENAPERPYLTDDKVTVLLRFWKNDKTGTIWAHESTSRTVVKKSFDTGLTVYPITWLNWDYIQECYHGQALITGLIPNQIFVNKLYAMTMISLMTMAYPKIIFDKTRIAQWTDQIGVAIGVNGALKDVVQPIPPVQVDPQIAQFIDKVVDHTQTFLGATSAALGDTRPDNTSARQLWHCAVEAA